MKSCAERWPNLFPVTWLRFIRFLPVLSRVMRSCYLNYEGAVHLTDLLTDENKSSNFLDESAREVLTEVGNILLNACLGMFGNLLNVHVTFSVPRLHLETLDELIASLTTDKTEMHYALVIYTAFQIRDSSVKGFLVIVLSVASLDRLIQEVDAWEAQQGK